MLLNELFVIEGDIAVSEIDHQARAAIRDAAIEYATDTWDHFSERYGELDPNDSRARMRLFDVWNEENYDPLDRRQQFTDGLCYQLSRALTNLVADRLAAEEAAKPRRLRNRSTVRTVVSVMTTTSAGDDASGRGGYYQDAAWADTNVVKVFVNPDTASWGGYAAMQHVVFGEGGPGLDQFVNSIMPIFIHEYVHYQQWTRGQSGHNSRGYVSTGGNRPGKRKTGKFYGGHFTPSNSQTDHVRYLSAAHEIESFAAGAAIELTQAVTRYTHGDEKLAADQIDDILVALANNYAQSAQLAHFRWLRDYRDEFVQKGFKGHELDTVFGRFMRSLYKKVKQFQQNRLGVSKEVNPDRIPKEWITWAKQGLGGAVQTFGFDLAWKEMEGERTHDDLYRMASFLNSYFFKDRYDSARLDKIEAAIVKFAKRETDKYDQAIAA